MSPRPAPAPMMSRLVAALCGAAGLGLCAAAALAGPWGAAARALLACAGAALLLMAWLHLRLAARTR